MLKIGSRGSKLALWQAHHVKGRLEELGYECSLEVIKTTGDLRTDVSMKEVGNKGIFTKEIEEALLGGRIDVAVHSLKDMPTALPDGLQIAATPVREDVRDVLIGRKLSELSEGARIGTGSLRRIAQLLSHRPDLRMLPIRGNLDTRIRKLDAGEFDAIVLAAAGMNRLGWDHRISDFLPVELMCPAVGQGSLCIETRADGGAGAAACARMDDPNTRACITAERAVLAQLGGGCQVPIGANGVVRGDRLHLRGIVIAPDASRLVRRELSGPVTDAERLGAEMARQLIADGAREILAAAYGSPA